MERLFDKLIGYVRAIEVGGVDVVDTEVNHLAQDRDCTVVICWRPEYMRTSQLHGTVTHASKDQIIGELECASWQCCGRRRFPHDFHVRVCHRKPPGAAKLSIQARCRHFRFRMPMFAGIMSEK